MGANYSFVMDNDRFRNQMKLMRVGNILQLVITSLLVLTGLMYLIMTAYEIVNLSIAIWVIDLVVIVLVLPSVILILMGLHELNLNAEPRDRRLLKSIRIFYIFFLAVHFIGSIFTLPIHINDLTFVSLTIGKNLISYSILGLTLFQSSFLFNRMQSRGYPTRMLFIPLIALPIPSLFAIVISIIYTVQDSHYDYYQPYIYSDTQLLFLFTIAATLSIASLLYLSAAINASFVEINSNLKRLINTVEESSIVDTEIGPIREIEADPKISKKKIKV